MAVLGVWNDMTVLIDGSNNIATFIIKNRNRNSNAIPIFFILPAVSRRTLSCMRSMDRLSLRRGVHYVPLCGHGDILP